MEEFTNKDAPMPIGTSTRIKLTHSGHTITQIEKSFSTILSDFVLQLNETIDVSADVNDIHKLFVGFKNAVEFYQDCRFWVDGKLLDSYRQDELQCESFAYNAIKPRDGKATSKFSHSTWEIVSQYSPSVYGCYVDLKELADGQRHKFTIKLTIPFTDQLVSQAWLLYPNAICGEIEEDDQPLNDPITGKRYTNCRSDGTSFGINFQLERSNARYVFDGVDSSSNSITVTFRGRPMYRGNDDTYYISDAELSDVHPPASVMWPYSDTYFTWSTRGIEYYPRGIPECYE